MMVYRIPVAKLDEVLQRLSRAAAEPQGEETECATVLTIVVPAMSTPTGGPSSGTLSCPHCHRPLTVTIRA